MTYGTKLTIKKENGLVINKKEPKVKKTARNDIYNANYSDTVIHKASYKECKSTGKIFLTRKQIFVMQVFLKSDFEKHWTFNDGVSPVAKKNGSQAPG